MTTPATPANSPLLPCPFCGEPPIQLAVTLATGEGCFGCHCCTTKQLGLPLGKWNTRTPAAALVKERDALLERLSKRDMPAGFDSWKEYHDYVRKLGIEKIESDVLKVEVEKLKAERDEARKQRDEADQALSGNLRLISELRDKIEGYRKSSAEDGRIIQELRAALAAVEGKTELVS